jgi:tetratricopeptide (TPR) repeat protein
VAWLERSVKIGSPDAALHGRLADVQERLGNVEAAETSLRAALAIEPGSDRHRDALVRLMASDGRADEAIAEARAAAADSSGVPGFVRLGRALRQAGDMAGAEAAFRRALAIDRESSTALEQLAQVLEATRSIPEAIEVTRRILSNGPGNAHVHSRLGRLLRLSGDLDGAERAFRRAIEGDASVSGFYHELAGVLAAQDRLEAAVDAARKAVEVNPKDAIAEEALALLLARVGHLAEAELTLERLSRARPDAIGLRNSLAHVATLKARAEAHV